VHISVRLLLRLSVAIFVIVLALAVIVAYELAQGPISLDFLTSSIEDAMRAPDDGISGRLGETQLVWNKEGQTLEIRAANVQILAADGARIASAPEMSIALSGSSLLRGAVTIRVARILHPYLRVEIAPDGSVSFGGGENADETSSRRGFLDGVVLSLLAPETADRTTGIPAHIELVDGHLDIVDKAKNQQWQATNVNLDFRHEQADVIGHGDIDLAAGSWKAHVSAEGQFVRGTRTLKATVNWHDLDLAFLAPLGPALRQLAIAKFPTSGTAKFDYTPDQGVTSVGFNVTGGPGTFDATEWLGKTYRIASLAATGTLSSTIPGAGFDGISVERAKLDLGGPTLTVSGHVDTLRTQPAFSAEAELESVPISDFKTLWPEKIAPGPRAWVTEHLSGGTLRNLTVKTKGGVRPGQNLDDFEPDEVAGTLAVDGTNVSYLPPLAPLRHGSATASFDKKGMKFTFLSGDSDGVSVKAATVTLAGFDAKVQTADISVALTGSASDALKLLDQQPLGYAQALGLSPDQVGGEITANLHVAFPLIKALKVAEIKITGDAHTSHLAIAAIFRKLNLTEGDLAITMAAKGMDVAGAADLGGRPASVKWHENFDRAAFKSRFEIAMSLDDSARSALGYDQGPFQPPYISGPVGLNVTAQLSQNGKGSVKVDADLSRASMRLVDMNWHKEAGAAASATAQIDLVANQIGQIQRFQIVGPGLELLGRVAMESGDPRRIIFTRAKWGRTDVAGTVSIDPNGGGIGLDIAGASFDASELLGNTAPSADSVATPAALAEAKAAAKADDRKTDHTPLSIKARIAKVWLSAKGSINTLTASMTRDQQVWRSVEIAGTPDAGQEFLAEIRSSGKNSRALKATSSDAGAVFRNFDIFPNIVGGSLNVTGTFDDTLPQHPLTGDLTIADFRLAKAPLIAHLLNVAALAGIVDLLSGEGIPFSHLDAPFTLSDGVLGLKNAHASGTSLGLTARGEIDLDHNRMAVQGTIVPAYILNNILGNLPLVGDLFTDGPGGGLIAINYSMSGKTQDPDMSVNPLSAFTPGVLRGLFNIFGSGTTVRPSPPPANTP
jgi:uncharacterized protein YhdP